MTSVAVEPVPAYHLGRLSDVLDAVVHDPMDLYAAEQERSLRTAGVALDTRIVKEPA